MTANERPSGTRAFFSGFGSGMASGAVMMGLVFAAGAIASFTPLAPLVPQVFNMAFAASAGFMTVVTGLFGGVMAAKRAVFDAPETTAPQQSYVAVPVQGMGAPALAPVVALDRAEQPTTQSWVSKTGRDGQATSNIQQILDNGALSDKERASAILAARETAANAAQAR